MDTNKANQQSACAGLCNNKTDPSLAKVIRFQSQKVPLYLDQIALCTRSKHKGKKSQDKWVRLSV